MTGIAASREQSIAFGILFAVAAVLAVGTIAVLGPGASDPLIQPAAMLLVWLAFRAGVRANLNMDRIAHAGADTDVMRSASGFAQTLTTVSLGVCALMLGLQIAGVARLAGVEPLASIPRETVLRAFFAGFAVLEICLGNAWPRSALAAASIGEEAHVSRARRFRGWTMTLVGLTNLVCALTLPVKLVVTMFFVLWLSKIVVLNAANALDGGPRPGPHQGEAGAR